jgi:hypothetical protein
MDYDSNLHKNVRNFIKGWAGKKGGTRPAPLMFFSGVFLSFIWLLGPNVLYHLLDFPVTAALVKATPYWELWVPGISLLIAITLTYFGMKPFWKAVTLCFPDYFQTWEGGSED